MEADFKITVCACMCVCNFFSLLSLITDVVPTINVEIKCYYIEDKGPPSNYRRDNLPAG